MSLVELWSTSWYGKETGSLCLRKSMTVAEGAPPFFQRFPEAPMTSGSHLSVTSKKFCLSGVWMERPLGRCPFCKAHPGPGLLRGRAGCFGPDGTYPRSLVENQGVWAGGKPGTGQGQANLSCASPEGRLTRNTANTREQDFH